VEIRPAYCALIRYITLYHIGHVCAKGGKFACNNILKNKIKPVPRKQERKAGWESKEVLRKQPERRDLKSRRGRRSEWLEHYLDGCNSVDTQREG